MKAMRRIILILCAVIVSNGWLMANHWTPNSAPYENNMTLTGIVQINGVEQQNTALEVGVFCGEECRGSDMVAYFAPTQHHVVQVLVYGENGDQLIFKLFDHNLNQELDLTSPEAITFTANGYGNLTNPYLLDFATIYEITATANPAEGGTVSGAGTYPQGATATLAATANVGYTFMNWTLGGEVVSNSPIYSFEVTEAASYVANFSGNHWTPNGALYENNMTLTAVVQINGVEQQTTALEVGVFCGEECRGAGRPVYFAPTQRYLVQLVVFGETGDQLTFKLFDHGQGIELDLVAPNPVTFTENGYGTLLNPYVLNFIETHEITVTANPAEGGTAEGAGTYNHGTTATLTATANTGYHFVNWTHVGEVVSNSPTFTFTVTEAANYVANFELNSYEITATANPEAGGTVTGAGTYNHFATATLVATPSEGYAFLNWILVGEVVSNSPTFTFTVTEAADYVANFELTTITQTTHLTSGWNWWSTYVEADDLFGQLTTGLGVNATQIKSSTSFVNYFSGLWIGGLNSINNESCYLINATNACTLEMMGNQATPANHPITINPNWNWIGYPNTGALSVANAFSNFSPANGDQVKSQNAFASFYNGIWVGGLSTITPGMGLLYKSNSTGAMTLIYPEPSRSEELTENVTNEDNHWTADYHAYPSNMTVMAVIELDDVELQSGNYEIAAFANDECRGSAKLVFVEPLDRYVAFLTVVGDEASELRFSLYNDETGTVETQSIASLQYETNAIIGNLETPYVIRFRSTTGMDEWANNINIFPNPVNRGEQFSLGLPAVETLRATSVQIVNALGVVVETLRATSVPAHITAPKVAGVYTLRITVEGKGTCFRKLVVR